MPRTTPLTPTQVSRIVAILTTLGEDELSFRSISRRLRLDVGAVGGLCCIMERAGLIQPVGTENGEHGGKAVVWSGNYRVCKKEMEK